MTFVADQPCAHCGSPAAGSIVYPTYIYWSASCAGQCDEVHHLGTTPQDAIEHWNDVNAERWAEKAEEVAQ
jgi:hypothetical protein